MDDSAAGGKSYMVTWGDTGLPVLACRDVYDSPSFLGEGEEDELLNTRELAGAVAAAANGRPCISFRVLSNTVSYFVRGAASLKKKKKNS